MSRNGRPHRSLAQREQQRTEIAKRLLRGGELHREIGEDLGISRQTVELDIKAIQAEWRQRYVADYAEHLVRELANIAELQRTAWEAWERSNTPATIRRQVIDPAAGTVVSVEIETRERSPDTRFLDQVKWCVEMRAKLLGLLGITPQALELHLHQEKHLHQHQIHECPQHPLSFLNNEDMKRDPDLAELAERLLDRYAVPG
jgi:hypothetical protein